MFKLVPQQIARKEKTAPKESSDFPRGGPWRHRRLQVLESLLHKKELAEAKAFDMSPFESLKEDELFESLRHLGWKATVTRSEASGLFWLYAQELEGSRYFDIRDTSLVNLLSRAVFAIYCGILPLGHFHVDRSGQNS